MNAVLSVILKFLTEILIFAGAYAVGNINPASIIAKMHGVDIREEGSGNPGTTNVIRVLGLKEGLYTLFFDMLKAFVVVKIGFMISAQLGGMVAFAGVLIGHCFPIIYKFKGGKGVAVAFGAALGITWPSAMVAFILAVIILLVTKKMSLGSLIAAISFPFLVWYYTPEYLFFSIGVAIFVILRHIPNLIRLSRGEENSLDIKEKIKNNISKPESKKENKSKKHRSQNSKSKADSKGVDNKKDNNKRQSRGNKYQEDNNRNKRSNRYQEKNTRNKRSNRYNGNKKK